MSEGLWITGPDTYWVAQDHVVALADYLDRLRVEIETVAGGLYPPSTQPTVGTLDFVPSVSWAEVAAIRMELNDLAGQASRINHALWRYAEQTASEERARVATFELAGDRLLAVMAVSFGRHTPAGPVSSWGFTQAAQSVMSGGDTVDAVQVSLIPGSLSVVPSVSLAERIARIPRAGDPPIRIERYLSDTGDPHTEVFIGGTRYRGDGSSSEPFDMASNVALVAGASAASLVAVHRAMASAGVTSRDRVTFVGHSQGGLIATRLAESGTYRTAGLLTVGAPVGVAPVAGDYPAIHLAHSDDLVPGLGGHTVAGKAIRIERTSGSSPGDFIGAHSLAAYEHSAAMADVSPAAHRFGRLPTATGSATAQYFVASRD